MSSGTLGYMLGEGIVNDNDASAVITDGFGWWGDNEYVIVDGLDGWEGSYIYSNQRWTLCPRSRAWKPCMRVRTWKPCIRIRAWVAE